MSPFHEFLIRGFTRDLSSPMMSQLIARPRGGIGLQILRNWFNIFRTGRFADKDVVFDLQRISKQINFVYGENDFLTNVAALKSLKAGRRLHEIHEIEGFGHLDFILEPDVVFSRIVSFFNGAELRNIIDTAPNPVNCETSNKKIANFCS